MEQKIIIRTYFYVNQAADKIIKSDDFNSTCFHLLEIFRLFNKRTILNLLKNHPY